MNQLNQLIEEILDFSLAIDHSNDTDHADYQQACHLFSDYIEGRISQLSHLPTQSLLNKEESNALNKLRMPGEYRTKPYSYWINTLFNHCNELRNNEDPSARHPSQ